MNIAILAPSRSNLGGVERVAFYLERALQKAGHSVKLFGREDVRIPRLHLFHVPCLGSALGKLAAKGNFDVVITNGAMGWNLRHPKILNIQHGTFAAAADRVDLPQKRFDKWLVRKYIWGWYEKQAVQNAVKVVAVSEETASFVEQYYKRKVDAVIPNTVDTEHFHPLDKTEVRGAFGIAQNQFMILTIGKSGILEREGNAILKNLLAAVLNAYALRLNARPAPHAEQRIRNVTASYAELPHYYAAADLFLLPSRHEGCSMSLLEAMACGVPVLTSEVGYAKTIKTSRPELAPYILSEFSVDTFVSKAIEFVQSGEQQRSRISKVVRDFVVQNNSLPSWEKAYQNLIEAI